jgi:hypothetical protein
MTKGTVSRRDFMRAAAAASTAAALPATAAADQLLSISGVAGNLKPAAEYPFDWWVSCDGGEVYRERFATREAAVECARRYGGAAIAECRQQDFDLTIDDDELYELMQSRNEERIGDGDFVEWTREQGEELAREVNAVIAAWAERHKINRPAWTFAEVRNFEEIAPPDDPPERVDSTAQATPPADPAARQDG